MSTHIFGIIIQFRYAHTTNLASQHSLNMNSPLNSTTRHHPNCLYIFRKDKNVIRLILIKIDMFICRRDNPVYAWTWVKSIETVPMSFVMFANSMNVFWCRSWVFRLLLLLSYLLCSFYQLYSIWKLSIVLFKDEI